MDAGIVRSLTQRGVQRRAGRIERRPRRPIVAALLVRPARVQGTGQEEDESLEDPDASELHRLQQAVGVSIPKQQRSTLGVDTARGSQLGVPWKPGQYRAQ